MHTWQWGINEIVHIRNVRSTSLGRYLHANDISEEWIKETSVSGPHIANKCVRTAYSNRHTTISTALEVGCNNAFTAINVINVIVTTVIFKYPNNIETKMKCKTWKSETSSEI